MQESDVRAVPKREKLVKARRNTFSSNSALMCGEATCAGARRARGA